jgi:hypothetical protein
MDLLTPAFPLWAKLCEQYSYMSIRQLLFQGRDREMVARARRFEFEDIHGRTA